MKVTICIPAYNAGNTIAETLNSLLAQSYRGFEIIVSDNHSTDNTRDVVERYIKHGVQLVTCPRQPVKSGSPLDNCLSAIQNWNSLVELGTGDYIGIYHADDVYEPDIVKIQLEFLDRRPEYTAVFPICRSIDEKGSFMATSVMEDIPQKKVSEELLNQIDLIKAMLHRGHFISSSGPMLRRDSWRKAGMIDADRFEQACDSEFWIRLSGLGPVGVLNDPMVCRRVHKGQDSHNGYTLYRERPLPIVKVLKHALNLPNVNECLAEEDRMHLTATCLEEDLRIALNLIEDGRCCEALVILQGLTKLQLKFVVGLWKGNRRFQLARLIAGKVLIVAYRCGIGGFLAARISRSRFGFPQWARN